MDATYLYFIGGKDWVSFLSGMPFGLVYSIYGGVDEEILIDSLLTYICQDEREAVQNVLATDAKESIFKSEDFLDI